MNATEMQRVREHPHWAGRPICPQPPPERGADPFVVALAQLLAGSSWT